MDLIAELNTLADEIEKRQRENAIGAKTNPWCAGAESAWRASQLSIRQLLRRASEEGATP